MTPPTSGTVRDTPGDTPRFNLGTVITSTAQTHPDRVALLSDGVALSYAQLDGASNRVANFIRSAGVRPGQRVALLCQNVLEFPIAYYGILKSGAVAVPVNVLLKRLEIEHVLRDSEAVALLCAEDTDDLSCRTEAEAAYEATDTCGLFVVIPERTAGEVPRGLDVTTATLSATFAAEETSEDDTAVIIYTSGTTGSPKGAELRHRNLRDNSLSSPEIVESSAERPDTMLCALPLFHSFGLTCLLGSTLMFGGTVVLQRRFDGAEAIDLMRAYGVTSFSGVPTMFQKLVEAGESAGLQAGGKVVDTLRVTTSGGAPLPPALFERFTTMFGVCILEGYGLSETSPVATSARFGDAAPIGSIGRPIPGVDIKLIDDDWNEVDRDDHDAVGELAIRGHNVMKGYLGRPAATAEVLRDGWFRTGDLGRRDRDGWFYIVGRSKDLIIRGGYNVYPREIEDCLTAHPDVALAAVVGVPHETHGEEIKAYVVLQPGGSATEAAIFDWGHERLGSHKYPRVVRIVPTLPTTATGKVLKREISATYGD